MSPTLTPAALEGALNIGCAKSAINRHGHDNHSKRPLTSRDRFRGVFLEHMGVSYYRAAGSKRAASVTVNPSQLADYPFFTPSPSVGGCLVIDIDRPEAVLEIFDTIPVEIHPSWVVETRRGAHAGWLIDPVDLRPDARRHPIDFARAVGTSLRTALAGDDAVDPLTPSRIRNPTYHQAALRAPESPHRYRLGELHRVLLETDLWAPAQRPHKFTTIGAARAHRGLRTFEQGERNEAVFDTARLAAYAGEDHEAAAWAANDRCDPPLKPNEVHSIIRSIDRYMANPLKRARHQRGPMPPQVRETLSELGRRGGNRNTPAQQHARHRARLISAKRRREHTDQKALKAQRLYTRGYARRRIAEALGASLPTISRLIRRYIHHIADRFITKASGGSPSPACRGSSSNGAPLRPPCTLTGPMEAPNDVPLRSRSTPRTAWEGW